MSSAAVETPDVRGVDMKLEIVVIPVSDVDRAKRFYGGLGWRLDADYASDPLEIGFNANYLKDILGQIDGDTVELHLADAGAPTLIRQNDKSPALYVLMPMRV